MRIQATGGFLSVSGEAILIFHNGNLSKPNLSSMFLARAYLLIGKLWVMSISQWECMPEIFFLNFNRPDLSSIFLVRTYFPTQKWYYRFGCWPGQRPYLACAKKPFAHVDTRQLTKWLLSLSIQHVTSSQPKGDNRLLHLYISRQTDCDWG